MTAAATMCFAGSAACDSTRSFFRAASLMLLTGAAVAVSVFVLRVLAVVGVGIIVIVRLHDVRLCLQRCEKKPVVSKRFCAAFA